MRTPTVVSAMCRENVRRRAHAAAGEAVVAELRRSRAQIPHLHSLEEGVSVLEEKLDELKDAVRANLVGHARATAAQVSAVALRLTTDFQDDEVALARDRLSAQGAVSKAAGGYAPVAPLNSAHEGLGYLRCRHQQLCEALAVGDSTKATVAAYAIGVLALRFVAEVPSEDASLGVARR